jgi:hypothetical protein
MGFVGKLNAPAHLGMQHIPLMAMICLKWKFTPAKNVLNRLQRVLLMQMLSKQSKIQNKLMKIV